MFLGSDLELPTNIWNVLLWRNSCIQLSIFPFIPAFVSFNSMWSWLIVSKAFLRSKNTATVTFLFTSEDLIWLLKFIRGSSVERPGRKPYCVGL